MRDYRNEYERERDERLGKKRAPLLSRRRRAPSDQHFADQQSADQQSAFPQAASGRSTPRPGLSGGKAPAAQKPRRQFFAPRGEKRDGDAAGSAHDARIQFLGAGKGAESLISALDAQSEEMATSEEKAGGVLNALVARQAGDRFAATQIMRVIIALGWAGLAVMISQTEAGAGLRLFSDEAARTSGSAVTWLYGLAFAGAGAALLSLAVALFRGGFSNRRLDTASDALGGALTTELSNSRARLARHAVDGRDIAEASLAGTRALDVYAAFDRRGRDKGLAGTGHIDHAYQAFLEQASDHRARAALTDQAHPPARGRENAAIMRGHGKTANTLGGALLTLLLGGAIGAVCMLVLSGHARAGLVSLSDGGAMSIVGGLTLALALAYLGANLVARPLADGLAAPARRRRLDRSHAIVATNLGTAPDPHDLARGLDGTVSATLPRREAAPAGDFAHSGASLRTTPHAELPEPHEAGTYHQDSLQAADWRKRDAANPTPRFVDTGFQASPAPFKTGHPGDKN